MLTGQDCPSRYYSQVSSPAMVAEPTKTKIIHIQLIHSTCKSMRIAAMSITCPKSAMSITGPKSATSIIGPEGTSPKCAMCITCPSLLWALPVQKCAMSFTSPRCMGIGRLPSSQLCSDASLRSAADDDIMTAPPTVVVESSSMTGVPAV